jgi:hypothetical protein
MGKRNETKARTEKKRRKTEDLCQAKVLEAKNDVNGTEKK